MEKKYGGTRENKVSDFYPPNMSMPKYKVEEILVGLETRQFESPPLEKYSISKEKFP